MIVFQIKGSENNNMKAAKRKQQKHLFLKMNIKKQFLNQNKTIKSNEKTKR